MLDIDRCAVSSYTAGHAGWWGEARELSSHQWEVAPLVFGDEAGQPLGDLAVAVLGCVLVQL